MAQVTLAHCEIPHKLFKQFVFLLSGKLQREGSAYLFFPSLASDATKAAADSIAES